MTIFTTVVRSTEPPQCPSADAADGTAAARPSCAKPRPGWFTEVKDLGGRRAVVLTGPGRALACAVDFTEAIDGQDDRGTELPRLGVASRAVKTPLPVPKAVLDS
jgi:hypothetical protein